MFLHPRARAFPEFLRMIQLSVQEDRGIIPRALRICEYPIVALTCPPS